VIPQEQALDSSDARFLLSHISYFSQSPTFQGLSIGVRGVGLVLFVAARLGWRDEYLFKLKKSKLTLAV
jgi:hypothetical protein